MKFLTIVLVIILIISVAFNIYQGSFNTDKSVAKYEIKQAKLSNAKLKYIGKKIYRIIVVDDKCTGVSIDGKNNIYIEYDGIWSTYKVSEKVIGRTRSEAVKKFSEYNLRPEKE